MKDRYQNTLEVGYRLKFEQIIALKGKKLFKIAKVSKHYKFCVLKKLTNIIPKYWTSFWKNIFYLIKKKSKYSGYFLLRFLKQIYQGESL